MLPAKSVACGMLLASMGLAWSRHGEGKEVASIVLAWALHVEVPCRYRQKVGRRQLRGIVPAAVGMVPAAVGM